MATCCLFGKSCYPQTHGESNPTHHSCLFLENPFFHFFFLYVRCNVQKVHRVHAVFGDNLLFPSRRNRHPFSSMYVRPSMCGPEFCMDSPLHNHQDLMQKYKNSNQDSRNLLDELGCTCSFPAPLCFLLKNPQNFSQSSNACFHQDNRRILIVPLIQTTRFTEEGSPWLAAVRVA